MAVALKKSKKPSNGRGNKKEQVLQVASECFLASGYDGTSINVMAREAGISKESIYRYFKSKEDLFLAVVERELQVYHDSMRETVSDYFDRPIEGALCHLAESALSSVTADRTMALRRLVFQHAVDEPKVGAYYFKSGPEIAYQNIKLIFDHHIENSGLKTNFDTDKLSHYFVSILLHTMTLEKECCVRKRFTKKEISGYCHQVVEDFLLTYFYK